MPQLLGHNNSSKNLIKVLWMGW